MAQFEWGNQEFIRFFQFEYSTSRQTFSPHIHHHWIDGDKFDSLFVSK